MHSTGKRPPHCERCRQLPRMSVPGRVPRLLFRNTRTTSTHECRRRWPTGRGWVTRRGGGGTRRLRGGRGTVSYSEAEWRKFEPAARQAERIAEKFPERHDLFLCHAWDDREEAAKDLYDELTGNGESVWFSETEVMLGQSLMREIDRGLAKSRIGIVLVTPALLASLAKGGVADKELSALLATDRVIPIAHGVSFEDTRNSETVWFGSRSTPRSCSRRSSRSFSRASSSVLAVTVLRTGRRFSVPSDNRTGRPLSSRTGRHPTVRRASHSFLDFR